MTTQLIQPGRGVGIAVRQWPGKWPFAGAALLALALAWSSGRAAEPAAIPLPGKLLEAEVLTRGPLHEAFVGIVAFNPGPGVVVAVEPPDAIEEQPFDLRPEGDHLAWIPGYWAWDDEREDFIWVSGTWRALPPGREWMAGYWGSTTAGYQWTSGYWIDAELTQTIYLPAPPATLETGPDVAAASAGDAWTPGSWVWSDSSYAWRAGYWAEGHSDWSWIPSSYVWTPRGHVFVDGYWDHPVASRGVLFAPVYFQPYIYSRPSYRHFPTSVIDFSVAIEHLFLRPSDQHYYFGDYYAASYRGRGYYSPFAYQASHRGHDPVFSQQRWDHREDEDWEQSVMDSYRHRLAHAEARPPRTLIAMVDLFPAVEDQAEDIVLVTFINELTFRGNGLLNLRPLAAEERDEIPQLAMELRTSRDQRQAVESAAPAVGGEGDDTTVRPATADRPPSPVGVPLGHSGEGAPPAPQQGPEPDPAVQSRQESSAQQDGPPRSGSESTPPALKQGTELPDANESARTERGEAGQDRPGEGLEKALMREPDGTPPQDAGEGEEKARQMHRDEAQRQAAQRDQQAGRGERGAARDEPDGDADEARLPEPEAGQGQDAEAGAEMARQMHRDEAMRQADETAGEARRMEHGEAQDQPGEGLEGTDLTVTGEVQRQATEAGEEKARQMHRDEAQRQAAEQADEAGLMERGETQDQPGDGEEQPGRTVTEEVQRQATEAGEEKARQMHRDEAQRQAHQEREHREAQGEPDDEADQDSLTDPEKPKDQDHEMGAEKARQMHREEAQRQADETANEAGQRKRREAQNELTDDADQAH